jgi:hypothetical protein
MRLLLDTHAFLWFVADDASLSSPARSAIEDSGSEVFVSVASAWEVAIKVGLGKLKVDAPSVTEFFSEQMEANDFLYFRSSSRTYFALPLFRFTTGIHSTGCCSLPKRQIVHLAAPIFCRAPCSYQHEILDDASDPEPLVHRNDTGHRVADAQALERVMAHRRNVVREEDTGFSRRPRQNRRVIGTAESHVLYPNEIDLGKTPA